MQEINGSKIHHMMMPTKLTSLTRGATQQVVVRSAPGNKNRLFIDTHQRIALWPGESTTLFGEADRATVTAERQRDLVQVQYTCYADSGPLPETK